MTSSWEQVCHPGEVIRVPQTLLPCLGDDSVRALKRAPDQNRRVQSQSPQLLSPGTCAVPVAVPYGCASACSGGPNASLQSTADLTGDGTEEVQKLCVWFVVLEQGDGRG